LRKIIVAIDFSPLSEDVLAHAASIARRYRSKLYIAHVVPADMYKSVPPEVMPEAVKEASAKIRAQMATMLSLECVGGTDHEALIQEGPVALTLLRVAVEYEIDLLVIGTRGHHGLDRLLQGSVAEEVFRMAPCPVLIVPPKATEDEHTHVPVHNILYPTSFSENSLHAAPYALSLARRHRARLILLHVLPETGIKCSDDVARLAAPVEKRLRDLAPKSGGPSRGILACVECGPIAERVVHVATEYQVNLIVLGIASAGAAVAHLSEGVTYRIVRGAPCPVLTIRN
jgi:nucleotide-binding universal stress UspA family protein